MMRTCQYAWLVAILLAVGILPPWGGGDACAQPFVMPGSSDPQFELADTVQLNRADSTVMANFQRVKAYLADQQWDEAVETLRKLLEQSEDKLVGVTEHRYVSLRDYVHLQLASLPPEALALYRNRVDPMARNWCEEGIARRDRKLLGNVLGQALASTWGDDALMALGEMALESGDFTSARWYWERIVPADLPADVPRTWPGYPDTDLDLAAVRARLVLTSILEGSRDRAQDELTQFKRLHADAKGRLGGREVNYVKALETMLNESKTWPGRKPNPDWPTFAGAFTRNKVAPKLIDVGRVAWVHPLNSAWPNELRGPEKGRPSLGCHPAIVGDLVLFNNRQEIVAVKASTGRAAWGNAAPIFRSELEGAEGLVFEPPHTLGGPRFTMTVHGGKLYARMGSGVTSRSPQRHEQRFQGDYLVCLDLAAEGLLMWKIEPEDGWAFEGSPVVQGGNVYVGMRRSDIRPQAHVACFDAQTGRRRWRRFICGAEMPDRGKRFVCTRNLLTLEGETLFYNTNLGAVAALSADDGEVRWVSLYPRALRGDMRTLAPHWGRALNPCVHDRGTVFVAPADSPRIFAFDAATGQMLWQTGEVVGDVKHLLGTAGDYLIACGERLYWISRKPGEGGRVKQWPDGNDKPGYGRGVLAGGWVLWPSREKIYAFDALTARPVKVFDLRPHGVTGGNLLIDRGRLLITTAEKVILMSTQGGRTKPNKPTM